MLKVTFPHMGNFYIPFRSLLCELGVEPVIPPLTSQRTIQLGTKISPEFACLPFKINLGNYVEAIEKGAECIFMLGGSGPCRLGYYSQVQREILVENGYHVDLVTLEAPHREPKILWTTLKKYLPNHYPHHFYNAFRIFWKKATAIDKIDFLVNKIRPLEVKPGACTYIQNKFYKSLDNLTMISDVNKLREETIDELYGLKTKTNADIPLITLVGEIYMLLEPRINFQIERILGTLGVEVKRSLYLTDWIRHNFLFNKIGYRRSLTELTDTYLSNYVGGHGLESVAHTLEAGLRNCHGIIHLAPFTCMPEIVAMQTFPMISREQSIAILSIIIDEHSAEAGILTRVEAFVDLLKFRNHSHTQIAEELPMHELV